MNELVSLTNTGSRKRQRRLAYRKTGNMNKYRTQSWLEFGLYRTKTLPGPTKDPNKREGIIKCIIYSTKIP